jgi:hypothetical protein
MLALASVGAAFAKLVSGPAVEQEQAVLAGFIILIRLKFVGAPITPTAPLPIGTLVGCRGLRPHTGAA